MSFNEEKFRQLVSNTQITIMALGTTSKYVFQRQMRFAEQLIKHLKSLNIPFERESCLQWVDSMEHDPAARKSSSYIEWIAKRRFVILLSEQEAGTLNHWQLYKSQTLTMPDSENYATILKLYRTFLFDAGFVDTTVGEYTAYVRRLLIYLENQGVTNVSDIQNKDIANYFASQRFMNRKPKGIQSEICKLRKFLNFLGNDGHNDCKTLEYAIPYHRVPIQRIVTTLTPEMVSDIMEDKPDSLVNLRDKAVCLLALHIGLRSSDICNLKLGDIDWEKDALKIIQTKTNVELHMPLDSETQNAIIDYVLYERRNCKTEYIFITADGPTHKLRRSGFSIKYRALNTTSYDKIPQDGLQIFRRTYASRLLKSGTPLSMISKMLGHVGMNAVQHYLSTDDVKMKRCALDMSLIPYRRGIF